MVIDNAQVLALSTLLLVLETMMTEPTSRRRSPVNACASASAGVFGRVGSLVVRRSRRVLPVKLLVFLVGGGIGYTTFGKVKTGGCTHPNSGSARAARQLDHRFGGAATMVLPVLGCLGGAARSTGSPS